MPVVLYAEDSGIIIDAIRRYLKKILMKYRDLKLIFVPDIKAALQKADEYGLDNIDILFTDGHLLNGDRGWQLAQEFRARGFQKPIIYVGLTPAPEPFRKLYDGALNDKNPHETEKLILRYAVNRN